MNLLHRVHEGKGTYVAYYEDVDFMEFHNEKEKVEADGYALQEEHEINQNIFCIYAKNKDAIFISYYPSLFEMHVVTEPNCTFLEYEDKVVERTLPVLLRQIDLEDFGLSYVIRMSDGRFLLFDGGMPFEADADKLMRTLQEFSVDEKPRIAAWIMSHPHVDHYQNYLIFHDKYRNDVIIEKFIYNFPDTSEEDCREIPGIVKEKEKEKLEEFHQKVEETKVPIYRAHTGQIFQMGDVRMEILSSPDNTLVPQIVNLNHISLMIKMEIAGQTIFWGTDGKFSAAKLAERFGKHLKCDIMQVPHHSFPGGSKEGYALIDPEVCLLPGFERVSYGWHAIRLEENHFLYTELHVKDCLAGGRGDITIQLPYKPRENGKELLFHRIKEEQKAMGSKSWIFMDLTKEETSFSILNMSVKEVEVQMEIYFDDAKKIIRHLKAKVGKRSVGKVDLAELASLGDEEFTVHFFCDWPVVIKGAKPADYC